MAQAHNTLPLIISLVGAVLSVSSFVLASYNTFAARRGTEFSTLFDLWARYEKYAADFAEASKAVEPTRENIENAKRTFLNLANFIENTCFVYNKRYATRMMRENIRALVSDFLVLISRRYDYEATLKMYGLGSGAFCETHQFIADEKRLLIRKGIHSEGSVYAQEPDEAVSHA